MSSTRFSRPRPFNSDSGGLLVLSGASLGGVTIGEDGYPAGPSSALHAVMTGSKAL
jgi:hypothetical protein